MRYAMQAGECLVHLNISAGLSELPVGSHLPEVTCCYTVCKLVSLIIDVANDLLDGQERARMALPYCSCWLCWLAVLQAGKGCVCLWWGRLGLQLSASLA